MFTASRLIEKEKKNFADYDHPIPVDETVDNEVPAENDAEPPKKQRKMAAFKDNCGGIFKKSDASGNSSDSSDDSLSSDDSKAGLPSSSHSGSGTVKVHANPFDGVVLTSDEDDDYDDI
uniref:Transcription initiation factor TFIID subunit 11-like n=1 Tax=Panagrellus redivivus TaxID=6233 RepID=A0A7E4UPF0_PANRE